MGALTCVTDTNCASLLQMTFLFSCQRMRRVAEAVPVLVARVPVETQAAE